MSGSIRGLVLSFSGQAGTLLLQHHTAPSMTFVVDMYLDPTLKYPLWIATFSWQNIEMESQETILAKYKSKPKGRPVPKKSSLTIPKWLIGRIVKCRVQKNEEVTSEDGTPTWRAYEISVIANQNQHDVAYYNRVRSEKLKSTSHLNEQIKRRIVRSNQTAPNNLRRPWRG